MHGLIEKLYKSFGQGPLVGCNEFLYQVKGKDIDYVLFVHKCHHYLFELGLDIPPKPKVKGDMNIFFLMNQGNE